MEKTIHFKNHRDFVLLLEVENHGNVFKNKSQQQNIRRAPYLLYLLYTRFTILSEVPLIYLISLNASMFALI